MSIIVIPSSTFVDYQYLESTYGDIDVYICDFYVKGAEDWEEIEGGFKKGRYINIDHHAPGERMAKFITSTCLACDYVNKYGVAGKDSKILINHTDCDSILSSHIMCGIIAPEKRFADASIDADHTGRPNIISDALQSNSIFVDVATSFECLKSILSNTQMTNASFSRYQKRLDERNMLASLVEKGEIKHEGILHYICLNSCIDTALLPALIPDSIIIGVFAPMKNGNYSVALRLGMNAPPGLYLNQLGLPGGFNGRWNAGNSKRSGGTSIPIPEYVEIINKSYVTFTNKQ